MSDPTLQDVINKLNEIDSKIEKPSRISAFLTKWHWVLLLSAFVIGIVTHKWIWLKYVNMLFGG